MIQLLLSQSRRFIFKTIFVLVLLASVILGLLHAKDAYAYGGLGGGLANNPYLITTCAQLQEMSNDLAASYRLGSDIDCSDTSSWNSGAGFVPVGGLLTPFQGTLDGAGYAISDLTINRPSTDYVGLLGYISGGGLARNIRFDNVSIIGQNYVGGVAGKISGGDGIYEVGITGEVSGVTAVGGVVGRNDYLVMNSYSHATISGVPGSGTGGGLAGENGGFILRSYSTGIVPSGPGKGGIIGYDADSGGSPGTYWDTQTSGINVSGGDGIGKTTAELKNVATFTDSVIIGPMTPWDFVGNPNDDTANDDIWSIDPFINQGYPYLADQYPAAPTTTITNSAASLTTNSGTGGATKASLRRDVAQASTSTTSQDMTTSDDTAEYDNPNSVVQTDNSNDDIKKSDTTSTHFIPWAIGGFSLLILVLIGYVVYRRLRTAA